MKRKFNEMTLHFNFLMIVTIIKLTTASEYGFDSASACGRELRQERARDLPCDFNQQSWCTVAGKSYPWKAVRRFVQENHGLMRRMYGDERHISVLQRELESNEILPEAQGRRFDGDIDEIYSHHHRFGMDRNELYSPDPVESARKRTPRMYYSDEMNANIYVADDENEFYDENDRRKLNSRLLRPDDRDVLMNTKFTFADAEFRPNDLFTLAYFRQALTSTTTQSPIQNHDPIDMKNQGPDPIIQEVIGNDLESNGVFNVNNYTIVIFEESDSRNGSFSSNNQTIPNNTTPTSLPSTSTETTTSQTVQQSENITTSEETTTETSSTVEDTSDSLTEASLNMENTTPKLISSSSVEEPDHYNSQDYQEDVSITDEMEGQLFQDMDQDQDESDPEPIKLKGVNACPVKEEVVAPFWANNTRGEILALLNLYPFEQYVHWEKCLHEQKQMYCRDGCRCEQQYRLHRLLAYDPNNECRGIFSDWFRLPSCCVCKCYDLPFEFRVTSRSPRERSPPQRSPQQPRMPRVQGRQAKIDPIWYRPDILTNQENDSL